LLEHCKTLESKVRLNREPFSTSLGNGGLKTQPLPCGRARLHSNLLCYFASIMVQKCPPSGKVLPISSPLSANSSSSFSINSPEQDAPFDFCRQHSWIREERMRCTDPTTWNGGWAWQLWYPHVKFSRRPSSLILALGSLPPPMGFLSTTAACSMTT